MSNKFCFSWIIHFIFLSILIVFISIIEDQYNINNHQTDIHSQIIIMPYQDMVSLKGGTATGSGICDAYTGGCDPECIPLSADQCDGSVGSCTNNCYMPACKCGESLIFIQGCME